jgi:hypothetical protein
MSFEQKDLLSFISKDVEASKNLRPLRWGVLTLVVAIPLIFNLAFGYNGALMLADSWVSWTMLGSFLCLGFFFSRVLGRNSNIINFSILSAFVLFATLVFPQFSAGFTTMSGYAGYWTDTLNCFAYGMMVGGITALTLVFTVFRWSSTPSAGMRMAMSQVSGLAGAVGLFFHCPNSDFVHLITGHGSQMAAVYVVTFVMSEIFFAQTVKKQLGRAAAQFVHLTKFDKQ